MKNLSQILSKISLNGVYGSIDKEIKGICIDSRKVESSYVFVAIDGQLLDGHKFVEDAIEKGACAVVVDKNFTLDKQKISDSGCTILFTSDTRAVYALLQREFYERIDQNLYLIGITGTNGKTTTANMIQAILEKSGIKTGVIGTLGYKYSDIEKSLLHTTPETGELYKIFQEMYDAGIEVIAMEVSSHALHQKRVFGMEFDIAVFTNLTQDHLDYHPDMEEYFKAKTILFDQVSDSKKIILNVDDSYGRRIAKSYPAAVTYGVESDEADVNSYDVKQSADNTSFKISFKGETFSVELDTPGLFNVYNSLATFTTAIVKGIDPKPILAGLSNYRGTKGRFQKVEGSHPFTVIIDYAHTPDALRRVSRESKKIASHDTIVVFGAGGDRDNSKRPLMAQAVAESADKMIITSDNPRTENPEKIIDDILSGLSNENNYLIEPDRHKAISFALESAHEGDVILIAGKGHEDYQIIGTEKKHFDDCEEVVNWLSERGFR